MKKSDYNSEPVFYCEHCLSLRIMRFMGDGCYCDACSSTDIMTSSIEEWQNKIKQKQQHKTSKLWLKKN